MANTRPDDQYDIFKDSLIRYCGYANEVGEAFRALVKVQWVWMSYGVASSYVLADALHKGWKEHQKTPQASTAKPGPPVVVGASPVIAFADTLLWQGLASVIIPGFTINRICYLTGHVLKRTTSLPSPVRKWGTTAVGLGCIPFIIRPIDRSVDWVMDRSVRTWYQHHPKGGHCTRED